MPLVGLFDSAQKQVSDLISEKENLLCRIESVQAEHGKLVSQNTENEELKSMLTNVSDCLKEALMKSETLAVEIENKKGMLFVNRICATSTFIMPSSF